MKICRICKIEKSLTDFYKNTKCPDGYDKRCKNCMSKLMHEKHVKTYTPEKGRLQKVHSKEMGWQQKSERRMKLKYRDKVIARIKVCRAIKKGELKRMPCAICGEAKVFGHHKDYSKPLDVQWLCMTHHVEEHRNIKTLIQNLKQ